jgi:hypothetical protein
MSKLNPTIKKSVLDKTERLAGGYGGYAAQQSNYQLLRRITLANLLWENCAYIDGKSISDEIVRLIPLCEANDVANLAIECRLMQKLRHTPLFITVEMCKYNETLKHVGRVLPLIITRADMLTDFLALYWREGKKPLANQVKKGLAGAFQNFDEYQFAKYDRNTRIKLRDVMFLCHPKPKDDAQKELFKRIANRELKTPDTWEVALSRGDDKCDTWTRLINDKKLGGLAFLRNIRNMQMAHVDHNVIVNGLKNMKGGMLLPLDYLKSARINSDFKGYIEEKMIDSYKNLPKLPGKTLFIVDVSGSMGSLTSGSSSFSRLDQACAMAMLAANQCESFKLVTTAGDDYDRICSSEWIEYPQKGFDIAKQIVKTKDNIGYGGIFTRQCLEWCKSKFKGEEFDRIIIFSDSQDCDFPDKRIPKPFGKYNYICDISAEKKGVNYKGCWTAEISGWSEHFITYIAALEGLENTFDEK